MATDSARQAVFQTAELLEQIVSFLPFESLWKCQRVSKQFQHLVAQSSMIQTSLWLRPGNTPRQEWRIIHLQCQKTLQLKTCFQRVTPRTPPPVAHHVPGSLTPARLCPLLHISGVWKGQAHNSAERLHRRPGEQVTFVFTPRIDISQLASWKDMYISDPPCFEANVSLRLAWREKNLPPNTTNTTVTMIRDEAWIEITRRISKPEGLKVGDLLRMPFEMPGPVRWYSSWRYRQREIKRPMGILAKLVKEMGEAPVMEGERNFVLLIGMAVPGQEEWEAMG